MMKGLMMKGLIMNPTPAPPERSGLSRVTLPAGPAVSDPAAVAVAVHRFLEARYQRDAASRDLMDAALNNSLAEAPPQEAV